MILELFPNQKTFCAILKGAKIRGSRRGSLSDLVDGRRRNCGAFRFDRNASFLSDVNCLFGRRMSVHLVGFDFFLCPKERGRDTANLEYAHTCARLALSRMKIASDIRRICSIGPVVARKEKKGARDGMSTRCWEREIAGVSM